MKKIEIEEQKRICLDILIFLMDYCRKKNLRIYLAYGTLLGAIRHKGYIPWDDDIDVMMPRKDYEKLLQSFPNHPFYKLMHSRNDENYMKPFATLNDVRTYKEEYTIRKKYRTNLCLNVDIFPFDNVPDEENERGIFYSPIKRKMKYLQCMTWNFSKGKSFKSTIVKNFGIAFMRLLEILNILNPKDYLLEFENYVSKYSKTETNSCGCCVDIDAVGLTFPNTIFRNSCEVEFEGFKLPVSKLYDLILRTDYKNYMQLPPIEQRQAHHLCKCYWR